MPPGSIPISLYALDLGANDAKGAKQVRWL